MRQRLVGLRLLGGLLALLVLVSCTGRPGLEHLSDAYVSTGPTPTGTYRDPFGYCEAVRTIDSPDARYVGPKVPNVIAHGLRKAFGMPDTASLQPFIRGTYWRCMNGKVFACSVGANLPCLEKADISRTPSPAMATFCQESPNSDVIPAYVTGRATVYLWRCQSGSPLIVRQVASPDERGYLANFWHRIDPMDRS